MILQADYLKAVEELIDCCTRSPWREKIVVVYLAGSVARGDFSPGRSDIDIYVVVQGEETEEVEKRLKEIAHLIAKNRLAKLFLIHAEPIAIAVTSIDEIKQGKSFLGAGFEYQNFMNTAKLLYGEDIRHLIPKPTCDEESVSAKTVLKHVHQLISTAPSEAKISESLVYELFSTLFRTACIALCGKGIYVSAKKDVVDIFCKVYHQPELHELLTNGYALWNKWSERLLTKQEVEELRKWVYAFVSRICALWDL